MKKKIILMIALVLVISTVVRLSFGASDDKFDYLEFKEEDYIETCSPSSECRMCFDAIKLKEFSDEELTLKTYITDVNTKTKDYSDKVTNFKITTKQVSEQEITIGYETKNVEYNHECENSLGYDNKNAWCYFTAENQSDVITFIHSYSKIDKNIIYWQETEDDLEKPIIKLANVTTYPEITKTQIKNTLSNAYINDKLTICMEGNVKLFQKVDVYPEIFGYEYKEYAVWDGSDAGAIWHFDETSGSIAYDDSSNEYDGQYNSVDTTVAGKFETGVLISGGISSFVNKSHEDYFSFGGTNDFTVCFWLNISGYTYTDQIINHFTYPGVGQGWLMQLNTNRSRIQGLVGNWDAQGGWVIHDMCGDTNYNVWHQFCFFRQGANVTIVQDNGACQTSGTLGSATEPVTTTQQLYIGKRYDDMRPCTCTLDDVILINRTLTGSEIADHYNGLIGSSATETQGDDAIERAINSSLTIPSKYSDQQIYARSLDNTQDTGKFDWFVIEDSKRWAINYVTTDDPTSGLTNMFNVTPMLYVLELQDMSEEEITDAVGDLINYTKT